MHKDKKDKKIIELKNLIEAAEISLQQARRIINNLVSGEEEKMLAEQARHKGSVEQTDEGQIIMGVFDGQNMVGADGKKYSVPANYASKSKLVEGDELKLTITKDGSFVYKQIHLLERTRLVGELILDEESNEFRVLANNKAYKILNASITYFKGEVGDKVALLVPKGKESTWGAVENIIKAGEEFNELEKAAIEENKVKSSEENDTQTEEDSPVTDEIIKQEDDPQFGRPKNETQIEDIKSEVKNEESRETFNEDFDQSINNFSHQQQEFDVSEEKADDKENNLNLETKNDEFLANQHDDVNNFEDSLNQQQSSENYLNKEQPKEKSNEGADTLVGQHFDSDKDDLESGYDNQGLEEL